MRDAILIRHDLRPGDLGRLIALHGVVYDGLDGFGLKFEAYVAQTIAEYVLGNEARGRIWFVEDGNELIGCSAAVLRDGGVGQIRWVVVSPAARGQGIGGELMRLAFEYCRSEGCDSLYLETTDGLPESQAMYEKLGFAVTSNELEPLWDGERPLIKMHRNL